MNCSVTQKIFFLHNPKAGGTSIRSLFQQQFETHKIAPTFFNAPQDYEASQNRLKDFAGFELYCGHHGFNEFCILATTHKLVTNFRDPVDRICSLYRFWKLAVPDQALSSLLPLDAACVSYAKNLSFGEFIRHDDPALRLFLDDFHFRQLLATPWRFFKSGKCEMELVKIRIAALSWFYVVELPLLSTMTFNKAFPELAVEMMPMKNVSPRAELRLGKDDAAFLRARNSKDYEIYDYARTLLEAA